MSEMSSPRALFIHERRDVLYAERQLEKALPKLAKEASDRGPAATPPLARRRPPHAGGERPRCRRAASRVGSLTAGTFACRHPHVDVRAA